MSSQKETNIKIVRGLLGTPSGKNEELIITKKGVIYLRKSKSVRK